LLPEQKRQQERIDCFFVFISSLFFKACGETIAMVMHNRVAVRITLGVFIALLLVILV
jgi:hypothetical protein